MRTFGSSQPSGWDWRSSASLISIRVGISVALIEILVGVAAGNIQFDGGQHILQTTDWVNFLAMLGSGVLTFLAGAEIDPVSLRANLRASMAIGIAAFLLPFAGVWLFAQFVLGWPHASGANRRHRALHDFRGCGLCRDD